MKYRQTFKTTESILKERKIRYRTRMFFIKQISNPSNWWYWLAWHEMGQPRHFLLMDVEWKWMHRHTNDIYRKNFYLLFNAFIYIKTGFLYKTMHHHTIQTTYKIFYKKHLIYVLSKHPNDPPRHLIAVPSIIIFGIKWKKKYMKKDLRSRLKTRENWRSRLKVYGKMLPSIYQRFEDQSNSLLED